MAESTRTPVAADNLAHQAFVRKATHLFGLFVADAPAAHCRNTVPEALALSWTACAMSSARKTWFSISSSSGLSSSAMKRHTVSIIIFCSSLREKSAGVSRHRVSIQVCGRSGSCGLTCPHPSPLPRAEKGARAREGRTVPTPSPRTRERAGVRGTPNRLHFISAATRPSEVPHGPNQNGWGIGYSSPLKEGAIRRPIPRVPQPFCLRRGTALQADQGRALFEPWLSLRDPA